MVDFGGYFDFSSVEERSVPAVQIFENRGIGFDRDAGVEPGHRPMVYVDTRLRVPPQQVFSSFEDKFLLSPRQEMVRPVAARTV